ncbi:TetR/AcrR family transcriptional regulator [Paenibacillus sp. GCM10027629]|uniref:TetR/AcrR family transcriptional regulator n=1 Tax=Paenibacillus sp. GCM10027629 TaxID=3273414 RepID=UPI00362C0AA5
MNQTPSKIKGARAEETKQRILRAAGELFEEKGFQAVTMREIAKQAGCSHTAIYMHCKDKEDLLHQLVIPPLTEFKTEAHELLHSGNESRSVLQQISMKWITFCLKHRSIASVLITIKSVRVDEAEPELPLNQLRLDIYRQLEEVLITNLPSRLTAEQRLTCSRIYFYMLMGIVHTYIDNEEGTSVLMERLTPVIETTMDVMIAGMIQQFTVKGE